MARELTNLEKFLTADYEDQFKGLSDPQTAAEVKAWMGPAAFEEYMAHKPAPGDMSGRPKNIVFAPGVMGSTLESHGLGGVWWLDMARARDMLDKLGLTIDGRGDIDADADMQPGAVDVSYVPFRKAIAISNDFGGSEQFPYDWRKPFSSSVNMLRDTILKVYKDNDKPVHLVGHSMGGLMIRATLKSHGEELWPKVGRIVFIGTPHYGSPAIAGYLKNHLWGWKAIAVLGLFLSRETFRSLRGVLSLLPAPAGVYPGTRNGEEHPCANFNMYNAQAWELGLDAPATVNLQNILDEVKAFHKGLYEWHESLLQEEKDRILMIAGVGQETLFRMEFDKLFWGKWAKTRKITQRVAGDANRDGDGSVPLASAQLEDVTTRYVCGEHGDLPNIPSVAHDVLAWLTESDLTLPSTPKGALGGDLSADDNSAPEALSPGPAAGSRFEELSDYENPTPEFIAQIKSEIDTGKMPEINLVKIL